MTLANVRMWSAVAALCLLTGGASFWLGYSGTAWVFR